jgi:rubrerythrin
MEELFAIAYAMEEEAAVRYDEIASRMQIGGNDSLAGVFARLAEDERGHRDSVVQWSEKARGTPPDLALVRWEMPETFDDEGAGITDPDLLTAYRSLSMAVRNEERAFAFWSYVAAHAGSVEIRRAAETMAHEELEHVATLRRERRRAFHAERARGADEGAMVDPAALERRLADELEQLAWATGGTMAGRIHALAGEARRNAEELTRPGALSLDLRLSRTIPDDPVLLSELLVDHYLDAAERISDEAALTQAQALAGRAVSRLAWLRADLPQIA